MNKTGIIETENLSKYYNIAGQKITALKDINIQIFDGEFIGVYGPSGSGKTTLLQLLGLLERPSTGKIRVLEHFIDKLDSKQRIKLRQTQIGLIFQSAALLTQFTALENVEMPLIALTPSIGEDERLEIAMKALEQVSLSDKYDSFPDQLSGGQRQRVAIARALVNKPKILLADEPTGDLDSLTGEHIVKILRKIPQSAKRTVLMVTHDDSYHDRFDRVFRLQDGKLIDELDPAISILAGVGGT